MYQSTVSYLVRATGLEPAHRRRKILNLMRLPIPPRPHGIDFTMEMRKSQEEKGIGGKNIYEVRLPYR